MKEDNSIFKQQINDLIKVFDSDENTGLKALSIRCYLRGVRDALAGADIKHIAQNIKVLGK